MVEKLGTKIKMALGRILGGTTRKEKDVVEAWKELCMGNNTKPTTRMLQLMKFDLREGGVDLRDVKQMEISKEIQEKENKAASAAGEINIVDEFKEMLIQEKIQHAKDIQAALNQNIQQIKQKPTTKKGKTGNKKKTPFPEK